MYIETFALQSTSFVVAARVFDIWESSQTALLVLGPLWIVHCVIDFVIVTENAIRQAPHFRYEPLFNICFGDVTHSWTGWLNGILYHAAILVLSDQTPLMKLIVRDGFLYFFAIFAAMLFNLLIWKHERASLAALPYWSVWAITTHALSRMLLSMGSVQNSDQWGQYAKIVIPKVDIELGPLHRPEEVNVVALFSDDGPHRPVFGTKISTVGKYNE